MPAVQAIPTATAGGTVVRPTQATEAATGARTGIPAPITGIPATTAGLGTPPAPTCGGGIWHAGFWRGGVLAGGFSLVLPRGAPAPPAPWWGGGPHPPPQNWLT